MTGLKLYGRDKDDVAIISSYMQDALLRSSDMTRLASPPRFVAMGSRFCWEATDKPQRVRTALQIGNVSAMRTKHIERAKSPQILSLLSLNFDETDAPAGTLTLIFAGGAEISVCVEACEIIMEDVSEAWNVRSRPEHKDVRSRPEHKDVRSRPKHKTE
ncbi:MAG: DUF2948 family protein [Alphaproteobacteria bacterium]|nr:DUF2948 family protein [Alphaproteobacteria bacterium]